VILLYALACSKPSESDSDTDSVAPTANVEFRLANVSTAGDLHASNGDHDIKMAPGLVVVHDPGFSLFTVGQPIALAGLEALSEDGNPTALKTTLEATDGVSAVSFIAAVDDVTYEKAPILPGDVGTLRLVVSAGQEVTFASMFGESNDTLIAGDGGALLDETGALVTEDFTSKLALYDMGTEVNQEPGVGADQAPRQAAPNTGTSENNPVTGIDGTDASGFPYPAVPAFAKLTASVVVE
jgi:hypothetical protein